MSQSSLSAQHYCAFFQDIPVFFKSRVNEIVLPWEEAQEHCAHREDLHHCVVQCVI